MKYQWPFRCKALVGTNDIVLPQCISDTSTLILVHPSQYLSFVYTTQTCTRFFSISLCQFAPRLCLCGASLYVRNILEKAYTNSFCHVFVDFKSYYTAISRGWGWGEYRTIMRRYWKPFEIFRTNFLPP